MATINSGNSTTLYSTTQTTTSVNTATNLPVPQVNETNFTTLYSNSSAAASGGGTSGNLLVSGNLRVLGTSDLEGAVTIGNSYILPTSDGTNGQVVVTDGAGNLTFQSVSSISSYAIQADTATGGANLTLVGLSTTDSVKFAEGTNIGIVRTDANTITISTVADNIPDGTAKGQVLFWDGSAWTANSTITTDTTAARLRLVNNVSGGVTAVDLLKQYTTTLADGSVVAQLFGFYDPSAALSSTNPIYTHRTRSEYDTAGNYIYRIQTDPTGNFASGSTTITAQLNLDNDVLSVVGNEFILNKDVTGAPTDDGIFTVNRGSSTDATLTWNETDDRWDFTENVLAAGWLGAQADIIYINYDDTAIDSYLSFKGLNNEYIKWNNTDTRFEFSDQIYNSQTEVPAVFEIQKTTADTNFEAKSALKLIQRVTDAASNATDDGGANIIFSRTSGASGGTEVVYGGFQFDYYGTDNTAEAKIIWTNDNFTEPSPGSFPGTYALQQWNHERSQFYNNSLFVNYTAQGTTHTATSIITSNTLVFGSAHGYSSGDRIIYTSTTQNGLTQNIYYYVLSTGLTATQCQLGLAPNGTAIALTNGTGLTLVFADLINRVGVNTTSPSYTLDVNGDANVETTLTVPSITTLTGDDLTITAFSGRDVTISTTTSTDPVTIVRNSATTNDSIRTITLRANSTGTPVIGFGNFLEFETETTPGTFERSGGINNESTGDNAGVLDEFKMAFSVMSAGANTERMVLDNLGNLQIDGDLAVNGDDITTTQTTFNLLNGTATTVNAFGASTATAIGSTVSGTTTIGYDAVVNNDLTVTNDINVSRINIDGQATINTATLTTTATGAVPLTIAATRNVMTALVNIIQGANVHCVNATVLRVDATTAMLTTYGEMYNNISLASFSADVNAGDLRLLVNPTSATSTVFSVVRTSLT